MKSLKLSKQKKEEMKEPSAMNAPEYPWGTRIDFGAEQVKLFPELSGAKVGDELTATVKLRIKAVRENETEEGGKKEKRHDVEMQITEMEFAEEKTAVDAAKLYD